MSKNELTLRKEDELLEEIATIIANSVTVGPDDDGLPIVTVEATEAARRIINHIRARGGELN